MAVAFSSVSSGTAVNGFTTSLPVTCSLTAPTGGAVLVGTNCYIGSQARSAQTVTCQYGSSTMTLLGTVQQAASTFTDVWGLLNNPLSGAQTITYTVASASNTGRALELGACCYTGAGSFDTTVTNTATSGTSSLTVTGGTANDMVFCAIGALSSTQSAFTQTSRFTGQTSDGAADVLVGDAGGSSSVSFASTLQSSQPWAAIGVRLIAPLATNQFFSMFGGRM